MAEEEQEEDKNKRIRPRERARSQKLETSKSYIWKKNNSLGNWVAGNWAID